jgi:hypothetical protein
VWIFSETREHQLSEAVFRAQNGALDGPKNSPNVKLRLELAVTFTGKIHDFMLSVILQNTINCYLETRKRFQESYNFRHFCEVLSMICTNMRTINTKLPSATSNFSERPLDRTHYNDKPGFSVFTVNGYG